MKEKPREFSVRFQNSNYIIEYIKNGNFELHKNYQMIEHSAYTKAIEALKRIENINSAMKDQPGRPVSYNDYELRALARDTLSELGEI